MEYGVDRTLIGRHFVNALIAKVDFARIQGFKTADGTQQRGFTASGRSEQDEELTGFDIEAHVVDGVDQLAFR